MVAMSEIQALADRIAEAFRPERIILFGSHASGTPGPYSDVDLLVVVPFGDKSWDMAARIRGRVRPRFPLDLIVRSPGQLRRRLAMGDVFLREVTRHGKVLYEASNG